MGQATIHNPKSIVLQNNPQFPSQYLADFTALNLRNKSQAQAYFGRISDNLITYEVDYPAKKVLITIHKDRTQGNWNVGQWNKYINTKLNNL